MFADRASQFADEGDVQVGVVVGAVIAHELGHLLLPVNAHTRDGIMRAAWTPSFIPRSGVGVPGFDHVQARLLRLRVADRVASR